MEAKQIAGAILGTIIKICFGIAVIYFVYELGIESYGFGYRVFADDPLDVGAGIEKEITIVAGKSPMEIGDILQDKGVIRDGKVFFVQELLSESHGELKPGVYTLNTNMTGAEIIAIMSGQVNEEADEQEGEEGNVTPAENANVQGQLEYNVDEADHTSEMAPEDDGEESQ